MAQLSCQHAPSQFCAGLVSFADDHLGLLTALTKLSLLFQLDELALLLLQVQGIY